MNEQNSFSNTSCKNIIITGASKGIGRAIAEIFAANGYHLLLCSRNEMTLYNTTEALQNKYPGAVINAKPFDLSVQKQAKEFGEWCLSHCVPTVVINNAGIFESGSVHNEPDGSLEKHIATNLYSAYHVTRAVLPAMMDRKDGHIFNICSIASQHAYNNGGAYSISKFGLYGFSRNLREEMKSFGVKVTHVIPGAVFTDSWSGSNIDPNRIMKADDVAKMIFAVSLLSPQACVEEIVMRPQRGDL